MNTFIRVIKPTIVIIALFCCTASGQSINKNWNQELNRSLQEFIKCKNENTEGINTCSKFVGESLNLVYNVNDFYSPSSKRYLINSEIVDFLKNSKKWKLLGHAYEQKALDEAQMLANSNKAVVAIYINEENLGHVAVILPGEMKLSGTWGFSVPNSASFFINEPEKSYIEKGLSYAFARQMVRQVLLYTRNY
jgi:hypothetical protein